MRARWLRAGLAATLLLGAAPTRIGPAVPAPDDAPVLVAVTGVTPRAARLWVRAPAPTVHVRWRGEGEAAWRTATIAPDPARDHIAVLGLDGLVPGRRHVYEVEATGREQITGAFTAAPARDADHRARVLWSGDLGGAGHCRDVEDGYPIFRAMARRAPDLFLFVGDTIYADHVCGGTPHVPGAGGVAATLAEFRAKHRYNRADPAVQAFLRAAPVEAIWDDHEVRNNFIGPAETLMPAGRAAFQDYFAIAGAPEEPGRLYRSIRWGRHVEVFILDTRQYRAANWMADGPDKTMLGAAQRHWLLDGLATSDATWKLVVTSVPLGYYTSGGGADSWSSANVLGVPRPGAGFAHERDFILSTLRARGVSNVVFVSGDVHHAEVIRHEPTPGFVVHELLAGPLSARKGFPRILDRSLHSRSLTSLAFTLNFGEIEATADTLKVRIVDRAGTIRARSVIQSRSHTLPEQTTLGPSRAGALVTTEIRDDRADTGHGRASGEGGTGAGT